MNNSQHPGARPLCLADIDVFFLAGGLGTRIQPVLRETPKLLAPIGGEAFVSYMLDWLTRFEAKRIVFGLGHRAEAIEAYLGQNPRPYLTIKTVIEPRPLGTAGAIGFARGQLQTDPVLVINGDSFVDADLCSFVEFYRSRRLKGAVICCEVPDGRNYGRVVLDDAGNIMSFVEKDASHLGSATVNAGVYLLSAALLDEIAASGTGSLERDIFARLPAGTLSAFVGQFPFIDIGSPESYARAEPILRQASSGTPIGSHDH